MANMTRAHSPTCDNTQQQSGKARPVHTQHFGKVTDRLGGPGVLKNPSSESTPHSEPGWMTELLTAYICQSQMKRRQ